MTFLSFKYIGWSRCFPPHRPRPPTMTRCRLYLFRKEWLHQKRHNYILYIDEVCIYRL